jgi:hypothetical protein
MHLLSKEHIIALFNANVKGVAICIDNSSKHCGKEGHWLESKMGIKHNSKNEPDIGGYEMKKSSIHKTTLGDFSASEYLFSKRDTLNEINGWTDEIKISRSDFIKIFGNPNPLKNNRYSWSGKSVPKYKIWNSNGQILSVNENDDILVCYSFAKDMRPTKVNFPTFMQQTNTIVIALWKKEKMKPHIEKKFNQNGFFVCKKGMNHTYEKICFGKPFSFDYFIQCIKDRKIIFDSGMYDGNPRNYSQFRGSSFWDELIIEEY